MSVFIVITLINLGILLTTITYWRNRRKHNQTIYENIIIKDTVKRPIIVLDESLFSIYHYSILGEHYRKSYLRECSHRLIDKCMDDGLIEIMEEDYPFEPLKKKLKLKLTILK